MPGPGLSAVLPPGPTRRTRAPPMDPARRSHVTAGSRRPSAPLTLTRSVRAWGGRTPPAPTQGELRGKERGGPARRLPRDILTTSPCRAPLAEPNVHKMAPAYTSRRRAEGEGGRWGETFPFLSPPSPPLLSRSPPPVAPTCLALPPARLAPAALPRGSPRRGAPLARPPGAPLGQSAAPRQRPRRAGALPSRGVRGHGNSRTVPKAASPWRERESLSTEITDVFRRQVAFARGGRGGPAGRRGEEGGELRNEPMFAEGRDWRALGSAETADVCRRQSRPRAKGTEGTESVGKSRKEPTLTERGVARVSRM